MKLGKIFDCAVVAGGRDNYWRQQDTAINSRALCLFQAGH